jgi:DNA gyrase inhibitor GyrI
MTLRFTLLVTFIIFATAAWSWSGPHRDRYETAPYKVVSKDGDVEIRDYPALKLATAKMGEAENNEANRSFRHLFGYISGENEASEKIAMTTPVFMDEATMSFVLPEDVASTGAPEPKGTAVALTKFPGGRFAVLRFAGSRSDRAEVKAEAQLRAWAAAKGIKVTGSAVFAYYDPPFTLPPLRRNEVLLSVQ